MRQVEMGKKWVIETKADYDEALQTLEENEFIAEMSDDFTYWKAEKAEVARQRAEVIAQAKAKGII